MHTPSKSRAGRWAWVLAGAAALLVFGLLASRATQALNPQTPYVPLFNSDGAIPVLMSNADGVSLFDFYYYGQDRFGAWPFLAARAVGHLFHFTWTPPSLHVWLTLWLLGGAFAMGALSRGFRLLGAGLYAAVLLANAELRGILFELAQVYPWQMTALLLAWWSLRRDPEQDATRRLRVRTFLLAFLAIWTSPVSSPLLLLLASAEAVRAHVLAPERFPLRRVWRRWGEGALLVVGATVLEVLLRILYLRYAKLQFGLRHRSSLRIDWEFLGENADVVATRLWHSPSFPWLVLGTVGACAAAVFLWRTSRTRAPREAFLLEGAVLLLGTWGLAAAHLPLLTLLSHVRDNEYANRYFAPLYLFGAFSGALTVALGLGLLPGLARARRPLFAVLGALALGTGAWALPPPAQTAPYLELQATARRLASRKPGVPLLGGYWSTYVMPSLQEEGALLPVPHEHEYRRTVWWEREMKHHPEVLVEHSSFPASGTAEAPEPWIFQYGTLLHLAEPRWETGAGRTFSLYRNVLASGLPHTVQPALNQWNLCQPGSSVTLEFAPRARARVMVAIRGANPAVGLTAEPLTAGGGSAPAAPVPLRAVDRLYQGSLEGGEALLRGVRLTVQQGRTGKPTDWICGVEASFVFDGTAPLP